MSSGEQRGRRRGRPPSRNSTNLTPTATRRVRPRRSSSRINSAGSSRHAAQFVTPPANTTVAAADSIRNNARNVAVGLNLQLNATYSQEQGQRNRKRICYCDQYQCIDFSADEQTSIGCVGQDCGKRFHVGCIKRFDKTFYHATGDASRNYRCMKCTQHDNTTGHVTSWAQAPTEMRLRRLGLSRDDIGLGGNEQRRVASIGRKFFQQLNESKVPQEIQDAIKHKDPKDYPTIVPMKEDMKEKHGRLGRLFETTLLLFKNEQCACCGEIKPQHSADTDSRIGSHHLLYARKHLHGAYHTAIRCTCENICKGEQFYGFKKTNELNNFKGTHSVNAGLRDRLLQGPKVKLCSECYYEINAKDVDDKLRLGRMFSKRNGFGMRRKSADIIISPEIMSTVEFQKSERLKALLHSFTVVEEAAIRQITPLISMVRLKGGNIGSKGNISCVWQKSKLASVLPNLPSDIKYIIIQREQAGSGNTNRERQNRNLSSTKFERRRIEEALHLLQQTVPGVWKTDDSFRLEISEYNLAQWPESGHLEDLNSVPTVQEDADDSVQEEEVIPHDRVVDGGDEGPATLQNAIADEESFEVVINPGASSNVMTHTAEIGRREMRQMVEDIADGNQNENATLDREVNNNHNPETATFRASNVLHVDGFADMGKTRYAWARAFPTLFIPEYVKTGLHNNGSEKWEWMIYDDITGFSLGRDKKVVPWKWMTHLMWRDDGRPAAHPTFAMALLNYKMKTQLQKQGRQVINTSDFDLETTLQDIRNSREGGEDDGMLLRQCNKLIERTSTFASNVVGTEPYWKSKYHEFKAVNFFNGYIKKNVPAVFHTGSMAEHHEFPLRLLLQNYATAIGDPIADNNGILENNGMFSRAVLKYKTVISHYLAVKMELFAGIVMKPVHEIEEADTSFEFSKGRGVIHYHSSMSGKVTDTTQTLMNSLMNYALGLSGALDVLDECITREWSNTEELQDEFSQNPAMCEDYKTALKDREQICTKMESGSGAWKTFTDTLAEAELKVSEEIGSLMEEKWGYSAMHHGDKPEQWVKPGGSRPEDGYRKTSAQMISSKDVLESGELKKLKVTREDDLLNRRVNMTNHCGTHKCSDYCLIAVTRSAVLQERVNVVEIPGQESTTWTREDGTQMISRMFKTCRMYFGDALIYDSSGENNLTGGMILQLQPKIVFDRNGLPRYFARRNHPRTIGGPQSGLYYGANTDTQRLLVSADETKLLQKLGNDKSKLFRYNKNLQTLGRAGLESQNAIKILERYLTSYQCKGGESSADWKKTQETITRAYCENRDNGEKKLRSLVAKQMYEISSGMSVTRDQASFQLSGGCLTMGTNDVILKCTVNSIPADQLGENDGRGFQWRNVIKKYKQRGMPLDSLNMYQFIAWYWPSGDTRNDIPKVPQVFGFNNVPTWPLKEDYSRMMITLYVPWRGDPNEHKKQVDVNSGEPTFAEGLLYHMWNDNFPASVRGDIIFQKINGRNIVAMEGQTMTGAGDAGTPTRDRRDEHLEDALLENEQLPTLQRGQGDDWEDFNIEDFDSIQTNDEDVDWSDGYEERCVTWLQTFTDDYYKKKETDMMNAEQDDNNVIKMFDRSVYKPENVRGQEQRMIVYHSLFGHYIFKRYEEMVGRTEEDLELKPPPSHMVFVEGKPGTGKTFVTKTLRNITRVLRKDNLSDQGSAPTGCAAALFGGSTHYRELKIPVGAKFYKAPTHIAGGNTTAMLARRKKLCRCHTRLMDEHSMSGRSMFGWIKYRHEELRRPVGLMDAAGNVIGDEATYGLRKAMYERPWGGVPQVYSLGDTAQLPPVMQKPLYEESVGVAGSSDALGRTTIADLFDPIDEEDTKSYVFVMENVLRQDDVRFLGLLGNMTDGTMTEADCNYIKSRCIDRLNEEDRERFRTNALHLCDTWKEAHPITIAYLEGLNKPIAKVKATLVARTTTGKNHMLKESSSPLLMAFCNGAMVMLLQNFVVEYNLTNGSVGKVISIIYKNKEGARDDPNVMPAYIIVDFQKATIPEDDKCWRDKPSTYVPIPVMMNRCEKNCCSMSMIPLRICVAITVYKSQGMTVGEGEAFENLILHFGEKIKNAGSDLVAWSRAKNINNIAVSNNSEDIILERLLGIGRLGSDEKRRTFVHGLREKAIKTMDEIRQNITALDVNRRKTFNGGCEFLLSWYNEQLATVTTIDE